MSGVRVSTRAATGEIFGRRTESEAGTDVSSFDQHVLADAIRPSYSVDDCHALYMRGRGGQTATRGALADAIRRAYRTGNIPSTAFMGAHAGLAMAGLAMAAGQRRREAKSIAHMGEEDVINELAANGLAGVAKRLKYLYDVTEEDEEDIKPDSLRGFATLMIKNRGMRLPQITVTDDGLIQAVWRRSRQGTLAMNFQESGDVEFTLLYGRWDQGTKRRRLSGELPPDQAMLHVDRFMRRVTEA